MAQKNIKHISNDPVLLASLYHENVITGWSIVADQVYAKDEHEAAMKIQFLNDYHGFMVGVCFINFLLLFIAQNILINAFLAFSCMAGYAYALWTIYKFQSPALRELTLNKTNMLQN